MALPKNRTILVAEDDDDSRELLCEFLRLEGYWVVEAADGGKAIDHLAREAPHAIILDLRMPNVDGWQLLAHIKECPTLRAIPTLIATAEVEVPSGFAVLAKPLNLEAVAKWLTNALVSTRSMEHAR